MSSYAQAGTKRQKVRESRDNVDYFQGIEKIEYNNMAPPSETGSYRYYDSSERICSRSMEEWLRYSISLTDFRKCGYDSYGRSKRSWDDNTHTIDNNKRCIKALFDLCSKLGIKLWTAFDSDLVPFSDSWEETKSNWDDILEYIQDLTQRYHVKLLWMAPDLHSHSRYCAGAFTSNEVSTFTQAATQIKKCLEASQRLNAECFLIWPHREGYETIFQTDVGREIKLFVKLLKMTAEYKDRMNFRSQMLIMPYYGYNISEWQHSQWRERERINTYMWDVTSCLYLLKNYNLERHYKVSVVPGHHLYMANVYNMLGGVVINNELNHYDCRNLTLMMKTIVDQGSSPIGGINLRLIPRRDSDLREITTTYVKFIDAIAKGLRLACSVIADQIFSKHLQQRYSTYNSGFGSRIISADVSLDECEDYCRKNQSHSDAHFSKYEYLDMVYQRHLDTCDHI